MLNVRDEVHSMAALTKFQAGPDNPAFVCGLRLLYDSNRISALNHRRFSIVLKHRLDRQRHGIAGSYMIQVLSLELSGIGVA